MVDSAIDDNGLEVLSRAECLRLLRSGTVGRLALCTQALPAVFPVNYVMLDERLVIRTAPRSNLAHASRDAVVAFETDRIDSSTGAGWSVMVQGFAREVLDPRDLAIVEATPSLARWLDPLQSVHMEISTELISGRRVAAEETVPRQAKQAATSRSNPS
jgi:hypothetical protein